MLVYLSISLAIFNKINLICKTAGQLLQWPPVVQYQQICNKIFVWLRCPFKVCGLDSAPAVGRRVLATENYLFAPFAAAAATATVVAAAAADVAIACLHRLLHLHSAWIAPVGAAFPFAYQIACIVQEKCRANINISELAPTAAGNGGASTHTPICDRSTKLGASKNQKPLRLFQACLEHEKCENELVHRQQSSSRHCIAGQSVWVEHVVGQ